MTTWFSHGILTVGLGLMLVPALLAKPIGDYHRQRYTTRDGLPHDQVTALAQTPDGVVWVGTYEGVARLNGPTVRVFRPGNAPELGDSFIRELQVAADGSLLVTTQRGGLSRYRDGSWSVVPETRVLGTSITTALQARDGTVWLGLASGRVKRLGDHPREWPLAGDGDVWQLAESADGVLWVASRSGLARIGPDDSIAYFGTDQGLPEVSANTLLFDGDDLLVVGTADGVFEGGERGFRLTHPQLANVAARSLAFGPDGSLLVGTTTRGILQVDPQGMVRGFIEGDDAANDRIIRLMTDREGNVWAGTPAGLDRLTDLPAVSIRRPQGLTDEYVRSILEQPDGSVLIAGNGGLFRWKDDALAPVLQADGRPMGSLLCLASRADGAGAWLGGYVDGLWTLAADGAPQRSVLSDLLARGTEIRDVLDLGDDGLWVSGDTGLYHLQGGAARHFTVAQGLPATYTRRAWRTQDGTLWAITAAGIAKWNGQGFDAQPLMLDGVTASTFSLFEASDGALWVGTSHGLARLAGGRVGWVRAVNGLPSETIFEIVEDASGDLWVSSNAGLTRLPRAALERVAAGVEDTLTVQTFGERAGLASNLASGGAGRAAFVSPRTDDIWVATSRGVSRLPANRLLALDQRAPAVVLNFLEFDGVPVLPEAGIYRAPPGTVRLLLEFAAPTFRDVAALEYRYRLLPDDEDWRLMEPQQKYLSYTRLAPGAYQLEVESSVDGRRWTAMATPVRIEVLPLWWQRAWFAYGVPVVSLLALVAGVLMYIRSLRRRRREVEALVEARTLELRDANRELVDLNRLVRAQSAVFQKQATTDPLTRLPNRRVLEQAIEALVAEGGGYVIALADVDHFKAINDRFSHDAGDEVLARVAETIRQAIAMPELPRQGAPLAVRWGGEEFALLWPRTAMAACLLVAERVRAQVEELDWGDLLAGGKVTISIGLAESQDGMTADDVIRRADDKLYEAKRSGRNRVMR